MVAEVGRGGLRNLGIAQGRRREMDQGLLQVGGIELVCEVPFERLGAAPVAGIGEDRIDPVAHLRMEQRRVAAEQQQGQGPVRARWPGQSGEPRRRIRKRIEALGARFDPNQHEALFEVPDETRPAGTVAQVVEQGYMIGERVLRPAKVGVTRGGPKA